MPWETAILSVALCAAARGAEAPMIITTDTVLPKDAVLAQGIVIDKDHITVDGNGATLQGPGKPGDRASFTGVGVRAKGRSGVTIRNLKVRGFESALVAADGRDWRIEDCDFSDNYHDPDYGWGDYERVGGMILTRMHGCTIRRNRANRVWNGCDLWESHDNTIEKNDFSHCSNVCLKLWLACRNVVRDNNLSYGIRISPGEVHARDSTSVLIETGSDHNRFERNDITHGGDGVFIRVLNGWCSRWNTFIENDCSYANNNGFEAWSPDNTYIRNKANHCSFGFWLGGSDHTVLIGNEAAYNGRPDGPHNAPEPDFVHGGIVIVGGTGTHTLIHGNHCHHNNGAGIVFRGDLGTRGRKWRMHHLVVQNNRLENNRWGLFARFSDWLDLAGNTFKDNQQDEFLEEVTNLTRREADPKGLAPPTATMKGPSRAAVGETVTFDASESKDPGGRPLRFRWRVGEKEYDGPRVTHAFDRPGFYRVGVTVTNGHLANLAFIDFYAVEAVKELFTEGQASQWGWAMGNNDDGRGRVRFADDAEALVGKTSLLLTPDPYKGADVTAFFPKSKDAGWNLAGKTHLSFWLRFENPNNGGFQGPNPIIRLHGGKAAFTYTPAFDGMPRNLLADLPYSEARHGWLRITMPLAGGEGWLRSETLEGARPPHIDNGLKFVTISTPVEAQSASALVSDGTSLYCACLDGNRLFRSTDGKEWTELKNPSHALHAQATWINGMLAYYPKGGAKGRLYLRFMHPDRNEYGNEVHRLAAYDIAADAWSWLPTAVALGHGTVVVGDRLYGIAHALGGNFGGPVCRVNLADPAAMDERTVLSGLKGRDAWWLSRAAQFAVLGGRIYGIKNDWTTPQPADADEVGDRLFCFDPGAFAVSKFAGGQPWDDKNWRESRTPVTDLGPLPFEPGHGAALVALPPNWCGAVGKDGGLFIVAGSSPSNHEGFGPPSARYAIWDAAGGKYTLGTLPDLTGSGTSAAMHDGRIYIKRGGMNYGPSNGEFWVVSPVPAGEAETTERRLRRERMSLEKVDRISVQFDSIGHDPFRVWLDGMGFE